MMFFYFLMNFFYVFFGIYMMLFMVFLMMPSMSMRIVFFGLMNFFYVFFILFHFLMNFFYVFFILFHLLFQVLDLFMVFLHLLLEAIHLPMKLFHFLFKSINLVLKARVVRLLRSLMVGIFTFRTQRFLRPQRKYLLLAKTVADEQDLAALGIITLMTVVSPVNLLVFFSNFLFRGGIVNTHVAETFLSLVAIATASSVKEKPRFIRYVHIILL